MLLPTIEDLRMYYDFVRRMAADGTRLLARAPIQ
jgi:hypothetical protein